MNSGKNTNERSFQDDKKNWSRRNLRGRAKHLATEVLALKARIVSEDSLFGEDLGSAISQRRRVLYIHNSSVVRKRPGSRNNFRSGTSVIWRRNGAGGDAGEGREKGKEPIENWELRICHWSLSSAVKHPD